MPNDSCLRVLTIIIGIILAPVSIVTAAEQPERLPNIVFMFADDLGYGDLGCYGHPYARTPAIDRLAEEGTLFTQFYVTGVTCNPSRTGLMTGVHPARFPKYAADFGFGDRVAITRLLKEHGYATGHFGKWHIGPEDTDGTYGIDTIETIGKSREASKGRDYDLYAAAIQFIKDHKDKPFYVNIWGHATHFPVNTPPELVAHFKEVNVNRDDFSPTMQSKFDECLQIEGDLDVSMRQYLGDVYQIDLNVDRVLKTLDELGLAENTIVVFSSDHGPAPVVLGNKGARKYSDNMLGYAGQLRGGKHTQYEGGTRVPFIVRWPERVPAGRTDDQSACSFIDWLPTLCSIAGIQDVPGNLDGEDISPAWYGQTHERATPLFWKVSSPGSEPAMREGKWKLHLGTRRDPEAELYDLSVDPSESTNVAKRNPEVVAELSTRLKDWNAELPKAYQKIDGKRDQED